MNTQPRHPKCRALPVEPHPDIHFSAMIPRRAVKSKIFLSVVIYVVKAAFVPFSATGENPANAGAARLCGVSPYPVPDTATALPKQARYQLRYTRLWNCFICGLSCGLGRFLTNGFAELVPASGSVPAGCGVGLFPSWMGGVCSQMCAGTFSRHSTALFGPFLCLGSSSLTLF